MSVSSSSDFNQTALQIITDALVTLGIYRPGATISTNDLNFCMNWLNKITKEWDNKGIHMWSQIEGTLFLINGQNKYTIPGTNAAGDNAVETTLSADGSSTSLTVVSTAGMTAADAIGIELDNNTRQWTTIVSVNSSTSLTITTPLTSSASSGRSIITYTTLSSKPVHISLATCRDASSNDRPVYIRSRDEWLSIPNKTTTGSSVNQIFWSSNRSDGSIYVWPTPDNCAIRIKYNYSRMLFDLDSSSDNADIPTEWLSALTKALMAEVSPAYGKSLQERQLLTQQSDKAFLEMSLWDVNGGSVRVVPNTRDDD